MANRENAIKGMKCCRWGMCFGCPYNDGVHGNTGCKTKMLDDIIALLEALDVTPEELERLKKCRHECKIECLLEHYEKIKAERDALLEARILTVDELWHLHPHSDVVWLQDVDKYCVKPGILTYLGLNKVEFVVEGRRVPVRAEYVDYMIRWCCWTRMPSEEQRRKTPWRDA